MLTKRNKEAALNILSMIATADGSVCEEEMMVTAMYAKVRGISNAELEAWMPGEKWKSDIPAERNERQKLLMSGIMMMLADGRLHFGEKLLCQELAAVLGYAPDAVDAVIEAMEGAAAGQLPLDAPTKAVEAHWLGDQQAREVKRATDEKFMNSIGLTGSMDSLNQLLNEVSHDLGPDITLVGDDMRRAFNTRYSY